MLAFLLLLFSYFFFCLLSLTCRRRRSGQNEVVLGDEYEVVDLHDDNTSTHRIEGIDRVDLEDPKAVLNYFPSSVIIDEGTVA